MNTSDNNTTSQDSIEPNDPQDYTTKIQLIKKLVKNRFLTRKNKVKVLDSMKRKEDLESE